MRFPEQGIVGKARASSVVPHAFFHPAGGRAVRGVVVAAVCAIWLNVVAKQFMLCHE